jgi:hypothetical protein
MTPTTIPFTITDEAAAHIHQLGLEAEFERIIEHLKSYVPGIYRIWVELAPPYHTGEWAAVIIHCVMPNRHLEDEPIHRELDQWMIHTFPPKVEMHFVFCVEWEEDARAAVS